MNGGVTYKDMDDRLWKASRWDEAIRFLKGRLDSEKLMTVYDILTRKHPKVYLCGPINGCTDMEANDWRTWAKEHLRLETLDPMRRDYRGHELDPGVAREIVENDTADIQIAGVVLVNYPQPSTGTDMEIRMAAGEMGKPVVAVVPKVAKISPWLKHHCTIIFPTLPVAVDYINGRWA